MPAIQFRGPAARPAARLRSPFTIRRLLSLAGWWALYPVRFYAARSRLAEVARLTDYELRDIGLMRGDIADVTALPRDEDPTRELARRAAARRMRS